MAIAYGTAITVIFTQHELFFKDIFKHVYNTIVYLLKNHGSIYNNKEWAGI